MNDLKPNRRWFRITPDRFVIALLVVECLLWLSDRLGWPFWHMGYAVLVAVLVVAVAFLFLLLWFAAALLFRWRFQFSIRSLLVLMATVAIVMSGVAVTREKVRKQREAFACDMRGNDWYSKNEYDKAIGEFNDAIRLDPTYTDAYDDRGLVWCDKREYGKAIAEYNQALAINPDDANACNRRGIVWMRKGEYDKAVADFSEAIRIASNYADAYKNRGAVWKMRGEYGKAISDYNQALALNPNYLFAHRNLAWLYATCPDEKYRDGKRAFKCASKAYQLDGGNRWNLIDTIAAAYAECGAFDKAKEWEAKAIDMATTDQDKAKARSRLKLYEQRKPYREEPKT
jgi:tetratricopeptide (TPR) repeat protein